MNQLNSYKIKNIKKLEKTIKNKKITNTTKIRFECPYCNWILRQKKPDDQHPFPSTIKPYENIASGNILIQNHNCRNPRCQKSFSVFWFKSQDFYNRI